MTDTRNLLERCARVMGLPNFGVLADETEGSYEVRPGEWTFWNPLQSVADAAELAIKCKVDVFYELDEGYVVAQQAKRNTFNSYDAYFKDHPTEQAAYCWAIVNVVAQMGGE